MLSHAMSARCAGTKVATRRGTDWSRVRHLTVGESDGGLVCVRRLRIIALRSVSAGRRSDGHSYRPAF